MDALREARSNAGVLTSALAWRIILVQYLRDDLDGALEAEAAADLAAGEPRDLALLFAWLASVRFRRGEPDVARDAATRALAEAVRTDDSAALAAALNAGGVAANQSGDLRGALAHYRKAMAAAERARDPVELCRAHNNQGSVLLEQGLYEQALGELNAAVDIAEVARLPKFQALALMNRGLSNWCLGRLEEANADYESAIAQYGRTGSREISYALIGRGDVHRERGDLARARALYEEGLSLGEATGDRQALVPGLYQLAKVLVDDEPERAEQYAERAVAYGWPDQAWALNALGWIVLAHGDRGRALDAAVRSEVAARSRGDQFGLAESLELAATSGSGDRRAVDRLQEALAIWREIGNPVHQAITEIALARAIGGPAGRASSRRAERSLRILGVRMSPSGAAGLLREVAASPGIPVEINTLGGFRIRSAGQTVSDGAWQSKKARDLVKILVAERGRAVSRDVLIEALWPDADPALTSNRLSVALSTLRHTLDQNRRFPVDHFIAGDRGSLHLSRDNVTVDVEVFLQEALEGLDMRAKGRQAEATERLIDAEALYAGDFLEEDLYEDWSVALREQARSTYISVAAALADDARRAGDNETALRYDLRLLERDRFNEATHLSMIVSLAALGRRGEARRRYRLYEAAMNDLGVPILPMPAL